MISIIIPTYNEAGNIDPTFSQILLLFKNEQINGEIIVVDDDSPDGTADLAKAYSEDHPVRVHVRKGRRGLSDAVIDGFNIARGDICVVMDADLSHPVKKIPEMIGPIIGNECDVTVGSRKIPGGGTVGWPIYRHIISSVAGFLARGVTNLSDPTSGFMGVRKSIVKNADLDPMGWKIVLEVVVKTHPRIREVPIIFNDRKFGQSKFGARAFIEYLRHLRKLYSYRFSATTSNDKYI